MKRNIVLLERGEYRSESVIGIILQVENTPDGLQDFKERVDRALAQHFDTDPEYFKIHGLNDAYYSIMEGKVEADFHLNAIDYNGEIYMLETWIY